MDLNLHQEIESFFSQMEVDENFDFNRKERMIEELKKVTVDEVNEFVVHKLKHNFGRFVCKFMSKNHFEN